MTTGRTTDRPTSATNECLALKMGQH